MKVPPHHRWDATCAEAVRIQAQLAARLTEERLARPRTVAGVDVGYSRATDLCCAAAVLWDVEQGEVIETAQASGRATFPYVPGLLTFREGPHALAALERLRTQPDVLLFDGQGQAHPRRMGIAAHLGVILDAPTIGCAKSRLVGDHDEPGQERGAWSELMHKGVCVGRALRTRAGVKPVFVSAGHRTDIESATRVVMACVTRFRLPEPTRLAHSHVRAALAGTP